MKLKVVLIVGAILAGAVGYWFVSTGEQLAAQRQVVTPNRFREQNVVIQPSERPSKAEAYEKERLEMEKISQELATEMDKRPEPLTKSVRMALKTDTEKELEGIRNGGKAIPSYNGRSYNTEVNLDDPDPVVVQTVTVEKKTEPVSPPKKKLPVLAAAVPTGESKVDVAEDPTPKKKFNTKVFGSTPPTSSDVAPAEDEEIQIFKAAVFGDHSVRQGGIVKFRTTEPITVNGVTFPRNTFFNGVATFSNDRLNVTVNKIPLKGGGFHSIKLSLFDQDMNEGIYAPVTPGKEAAADQALMSAEQILSTTNPAAGLVGNGVSQIFRSSVNGVQKISVSDAYPVFFMIANQK